MKYTLYIKSIALLLICAGVKGQIVIGNQITTGGSSILLDFETDPNNTRGIILPATENLPESPENGSFVFDHTDNILKMYENGEWVNLTEQGDGTMIEENPSNEIGEGVIIGAYSTAAEGILVLEASDKALVLPKVENPHLTVKSPYPGMMCYDTVSKSLAVFDGKKWFFWN